MTEEEEAELIRRVMEESARTHDKGQWTDMERVLALSAAGDVAIPELEMAVVIKEEVKEEVAEEPALAAWNPRLVGQSWGWSATASEMADALAVQPWAPTPPRSPEPEQEP